MNLSEGYYLISKLINWDRLKYYPQPVLSKQNVNLFRKGVDIEAIKQSLCLRLVINIHFSFSLSPVSMLSVR